MVQKDSPALKQITVLDAQWSDCPDDVYQQIRDIWRDAELGNDNYIYKWDSEYDPENYPIVAKYLEDNGVKECWIHWWW